MSPWQVAEALEERNLVRYADFIVPLKSGKASVHCLSPDGLVITQPFSVSAIAFPKGDADALAKRIPRGKRSVTVHGTRLKTAVENLGHYKFSLLTVQYVYNKGSINLSFPQNFNFRLVRMEDKALVTRHYHLVNENVINSCIRQNQLTALEVDGQMVGFIGIHYGGSMGALEIFPGQRRHGYGEALERYLISSQLSKGIIPFCHIVDGNVRSLLLQKKLGLVPDTIPVYWN